MARARFATLALCLAALPGPLLAAPATLTDQEKAIQGALKEQGTAKRDAREDLVAGAKAYLAAKAEDAKTDGKAAERLQPFERGYLANHPGIPASKAAIIAALQDAADKEPKDKTPKSGALLSAGIRTLLRKDVQAYADAADKTKVDEALPKWAAGLTDGMKLEDALKALPGGKAAPAAPAAGDLSKALETLFPGKDGKVPRAVVEFLAKDQASKDELIAAAAGTNQAAVKAKWTDAAVKKIGDHLADMTADPYFSYQLASKDVNQRELLGYYCPRRPPPPTGKPAMSQLKVADGQGSSAVKSGTAEGASANASLDSVDALGGKCDGVARIAKDSPAGAPADTFKPTSPALTVKDPPKPDEKDKDKPKTDAPAADKPADKAAADASDKTDLPHPKFLDKNFTRMVAGAAGGIVGGLAAAALLPSLGPIGIVLGVLAIGALFVWAVW